jgi:hypothetical protein
VAWDPMKVAKEDAEPAVVVAANSDAPSMVAATADAAPREVAPFAVWTSRGATAHHCAVVRAKTRCYRKDVKAGTWLHVVMPYVVGARSHQTMPGLVRCSAASTPPVHRGAAHFWQAPPELMPRHACPAARHLPTHVECQLPQRRVCGGRSALPSCCVVRAPEWRTPAPNPCPRAPRQVDRPGRLDHRGRVDQDARPPGRALLYPVPRVHRG